MSLSMTFLSFWFIFLSYFHSTKSITLTNIASSAGINFGRAPSAEYANRIPFNDQFTVPVKDLVGGYPTMAGGYSGPGLIDFNNDGCIDIMVPNGPGYAHALYKNKCDGTFEDIAVSAGIDDPATDGSGICFGDLDNDGYDDIVIAGRSAFSYIFWNNGNEQFTKSNAIAVSGTDEYFSATCSIGDVNNDGYLDIFIGNAVRAFSTAWVFGEDFENGATFSYNDHNELYLNNGDGTFTDISDSSGIKRTFILPFPFFGSPTITWANALVDINQDGNLDIVWVDDQAAASRSFVFGVDRGLMHIFLGDGTGNFNDFPQLESGLYNAASWMGLAFGDLNCDNEIDVFITNFGDYAVGNSNNPRVDPSVLGIPFGAQQSREMYGQGSIIGSFYDPIHELIDEAVPTPFGWGVGMLDIENDGDLDVVYYGGLDNAANGLVLDNPGMILLNGGCDDLTTRNRVKFTRDTQAIEFDPNCNDLADGFTPPQTCTRHNLRLVRGLAVGDLDNNGFDDIVSLATFSIVGTDNRLRESIVSYGNELDLVAFSTGLWNESSNASNPDAAPGTGTRSYNVGDDYAFGDLAVEINSGNNNNYIQILLTGGMGILDINDYDKLSNRNGIGALIRFYPINRNFRSLDKCNKVKDVTDYYGNMIFIPLTAGDSHASQHSLKKTFGLGDNKRGSFDITWPSGFKNVIYGLNKNDFYNLYEIPASYDDCTLSTRDVVDIINDVADTYDMPLALQRRYRQSMRLRHKEECKNSAQARGLSNVHSSGNGNIIYILVIVAVFGVLCIGFGVGVLVRKKLLKESYNTNQNNLQKEIQVTKVSSQSQEHL